MRNFNLFTANGYINCKAMLEYVPNKYIEFATPQQIEERQEVFRFKDGDCSERIMKWLCENIKESIKAQGEKKDWIVVFAPASSDLRTDLRFEEIMISLLKNGFNASLDAIQNRETHAPKHQSGSKEDHTDSYFYDKKLLKGKNVIIIDDVCTSGNTLTKLADKLLGLGVKHVEALVAAKTIHPDPLSI